MGESIAVLPRVLESPKAKGRPSCRTPEMLKTSYGSKASQKRTLPLRTGVDASTSAQESRAGTHARARADPQRISEQPNIGEKPKKNPRQNPNEPLPDAAHSTPQTPYISTFVPSYRITQYIFKTEKIQLTVTKHA